MEKWIMNIHEYQAKELFKKFDIPIPRGRVAFHKDEAKEIAKELAVLPVVVKAQIHAGGRGKGGEDFVCALDHVIVLTVKNIMDSI